MRYGSVLLMSAVLAMSAAPLAGQAHQHGQTADAGQGGPHAMICTMGMLPHPGMAGGMMGGQAMGGGMQQGAMSGMQHGAMGNDSARTGGMQHGAAGGMHGAQAGGHAGMEHPVTPTMLLHHAGDLGLSADQQAQVSRLAETSQGSCGQHLAQAAQAHQAASALLEQDVASPDLAAYQAKLQEAVGHLLEAHLAVVRAGSEAAALLTAEQKEKLAATARAGHD